jgi:gliding motility-associated-like protein
MADELPSGEYEVEVVDSNGCLGIGKIRLLDAVPQLRMPTGFYPVEDVLYSGVSNCPIDYELKVFNRWGQLIYYGSSGWDGFIEGVEAPTGTYTYRIEYSFTIDGTVRSENQIGTFVLLR